MTKVFNGFLWGIGFSIAFATAMTIWALTAQPRIEAIFSESYNAVKSDYEFSFVNALGLEITGSTVKEDHIILSYKMINLNSSSRASLYTIRFSLFSKDGHFMGNCDNPIPELYTDNEIIYLTSKCVDLLRAPKEFGNSIISVVRNRDQLEFKFVNEIG